MDINEHVPHFPQPLYEGHVIENSASAISVITLFAIDEDAGIHGVRVYGIAVSGSQIPFGITTVVAGNGSLVGILQSTESLDREVNGTIDVTVYAMDPEGLYGTTVVRVIIDDVNDNDPYFERDFYNMEVPWDAGVGSSVGRVVAIDPDTCKCEEDVLCNC